MSDRSKKILWIAVAMSGFALVVLLAAFLLFPPAEASESRPFDLTKRSPSKPLSPNDFSAFPSIVVQPSGETTQLPTESQPKSTSENKSSSTVIVVPAPAANQTTTSAPQNEKEPAGTGSVPKPASSSVSGQSTAKTPQTSVPTAKSSAPPVASPVAEKPVSPPSPQPSTKAASSAEYWIQVGSFSAKDTADKLRDEFAARGMTSIIAVKEIGGRNYYQVKVGPYPSADEAKKWLSTVKAVQGASQDAFVTTR
jgi:cell division protein FtsN